MRHKIKERGEISGDRRLIDFRLYLITGRKVLASGRSLPGSVEEALKGGARAIQLREKDLGTREILAIAFNLRRLTADYNAKLFINDRVDIALAAGADGVQLGSTGIPPSAARKAAGDSLLIGASTHSVEEAKKAEDDGADFVTLGPVYETPSKMRYGRPLGPDILKKAMDEISIPIFAIGGIKLEKVGEVIKAGAHGIALISAILATDDIKSNTEKFMRLLR